MICDWLEINSVGSKKLSKAGSVVSGHCALAVAVIGCWSPMWLHPSANSSKSRLKKSRFIRKRKKQTRAECFKHSMDTYCGTFELPNTAENVERYTWDSKTAFFLNWKHQKNSDFWMFEIFFFQKCCIVPEKPKKRSLSLAKPEKLLILKNP